MTCKSYDISQDADLGSLVACESQSGGIVTLVKNRPFSVDSAPTPRALND